MNSPTTLALKSSIFLKSNDGFDHAHHLQKKNKKNLANINSDLDIKKTVRISNMLPCPRDGATLTS